jgi:hypothetical protein
MSAVAFLLALPLAVWSLAALYTLIDGPDLASAIRTICVRTVAILIFVGLFGSAGHGPLVWAFGLVAALHLLTSVAGRWLIASRGFNSKADP